MPVYWKACWNFEQKKRRYRAVKAITVETLYARLEGRFEFKFPAA